jgi:hypothetical protein
MSLKAIAQQLADRNSCQTPADSEKKGPPLTFVNNSFNNFPYGNFREAFLGIKVQGINLQLSFLSVKFLSLLLNGN